MAAPPPLPGEPDYARNKFDKKAPGTGGAKPAPPEGAPEGMEELLNGIDEIDGGLPDEEDMPMGGDGDKTGMMDMMNAHEGGESGEPGAVLAKALDIAPEKGKKLYLAAQKVKATTDVPAEELATMLDKDFGLRMRLEELAATTEDEMGALEAEKAPKKAENPAGPPEIADETEEMSA